MRCSRLVRRPSSVGKRNADSGVYATATVCILQSLRLRPLMHGVSCHQHVTVVPACRLALPPPVVWQLLVLSPLLQGLCSHCRGQYRAFY
jgi:hypothetical protein